MAPRKSNGSSGKRTRPQLMDTCVVKSTVFGVNGIEKESSVDVTQKKARVEAAPPNEQEVPIPAPISEVNSPSVSSNEGSNNARLMRPLEATNKAVSMSVQFAAEQVKSAFNDTKRKSLPTMSEDNMSHAIMETISSVLFSDSFRTALTRKVDEQAKIACAAIHTYDAAKTARVQLSEDAKKYRSSILRFKPTLACGMSSVQMLIDKFPMPETLSESDKKALIAMLNRWATSA